MAGTMALHRRCGARARRPKPRLSQRARPARRGPVMAGRSCSGHRSTASECLGLVTVGCHAEVSPSRDRNDHRGGCGASLKHRARDALGLADLRQALPFRSNQSGRRAHRTSTRLDVARRRGPRVQLDPWRPARPRSGAGGKRAKKTGLPGASIKNTGDGAWVCRIVLRVLLRQSGTHLRATPVTVLQQF